MISPAKCRLPILLCVCLCACAPVRKMESVRSGAYVPGLALAEDVHTPDVPVERLVSDTMMIKDADGRDLIIMKAVRDENGDMVASDVIAPSVVVASFRNVAERLGKVDLRFDINVPSDLTDSRWQLRLSPVMHIMGETVALDPVFITGNRYRAAQLRGYERYARFIDGIVTDSTLFIRKNELELFLRRNLPDLYAFREDSSRVSDEQWSSAFGVTGEEAVEHYTDHFRKRMNARKASRKEKMFRRYVKAPIRTEALRLDTVVVAESGDITYAYVQTINTRPGLRKVEIELEGGVFEEDRELCKLPSPGMLTFYISSLSAFVDARERYLTRVLERRAAANTACYVDFAQGSSEVDLSLSHNAEEIGRIRGNITELLQNTSFDLDSIVISASASPEGTVRSNGALAERRAAAVAEYFDSFMRHWRDSVSRGGFSVSVGDGGDETILKHSVPTIPFLSRSAGENWAYLSVLVDEDSVLTAADRLSYIHHLEIADVDQRERAMQAEPWYRYMRETLYPRLRTVRFDFYLHRKGMVKDTVHTTELDTLYMRGVRLLQEREYEKALTCLRDYRDYNTAIAYVSLDYNASAMAILRDLPRTPQVSYMLALLYARAGDDGKAVENYLAACREDRSYVFRGNLDPEIYVLIQRYGLNREDDIDAY